MSEPRFVHLRVHSDYSMIDGLAKTAPLVKKAAALGMPALAITDFTNLCGLVKFYGAGHGAGIKPIVGADFNVQCDLLGDELTHLTVLAANNTGYQNLALLISKAYQRGYGAAGPIIDRDWLIELNEGLILLSGGRMGDVGRSLLRGNSALVDECVAFYEEHFPDRYFLELIRTGRPDEESYLHAAVELAEARGLPVVATNDVRFIDSSDFDATRSGSPSTTLHPDGQAPAPLQPPAVPAQSGGDGGAVCRHPGSPGKHVESRGAAT
ncbi:PHP domain-containing protein [Shigella flexneri]